ncbi:hypothetical protein B296_00023678 [Ensete ventricosum]|uniref:Uncharacterized protein n=1 Tax=Ensete ventricosum TaxID=4639 RepID=A0A427AW71_ENSVE|nr:hypothetical protein B296_00023678 [Ensete ventricosum]
MDEKSSKALEVMLKEHDEDSIITKSSLPKIRATYRILGDFYIHIHGVGQHPFDPFLNGFSLSVDALEAGVRFPLHPLVISSNEATVKLDKVQCWKTEALKKVKALEKDLQGLKGDMVAAGAKN